MSRKVVLTVAPLVAAAAVVAYFGFFFFRDNFSTHYPVKVLSAESYRALEIPWWNVHDGGGQPLAGNPNTLTFYPDNVLYLFLPAHVAFNLHFLLHLAAAWWAMHALSRSRFAATVYVLSGVVISATAFYNLITATALIPLALLGAERRSWRLLGIAFGLMLLAAEPVTLIGAAISVAIVSVAAAADVWRRRPGDALRRVAGATLVHLFAAILLALAIGAPQLIAFFEIAPEVERALGSSARTVLTTSLDAKRVAEIFVWPLTGFLNDAWGMREKLFSTLFLGIIAIPALWRRSRYTIVAAVMLFLAMGLYRPVVEQFAWLRIMRFPEKFALPLTVALVVLIARFYEESRHRRVWLVVTLVPLIITTALALPLDWFAPYRVTPVPPRRVYVTPMDGIPPRARDEFRERARRLEPLFGATAGLRYVIHKSPDRMHSTLSRIVVDRFSFARERYLAVAKGPDARIVSRVVAARSIDEAVARFERGEEVAPSAFVSAPARVVAYRERGQCIEIDVETAGPALLLVNQSYFRAWNARSGDAELETIPVDIDRLGVIVPKSGRIVLTFGRHRALVAVTWLLSLLLLAGTALVEKRDRRAGEVERAADEH